MRLAVAIIFAAITSFACENAYAQKIESVSLKSTDPIDFSDIIRKSAPNKMVKAKIYFPTEGSGPFPAMVISHSSGGVGDREDRWAKLFTRNGIVAIVPDTFGSRSVDQTVTNQGKISFAMSVADSIAAYNFLASEIRVDNKRIGIIGFSRGGIVSNLLAHKPFMIAGAGENKSFATHVSLYPGCNWRISKYQTTGAPFLFLLGEKDDQTPAHTCNPIIEALKLAGSPVEVKIYKGAYHAFDKKVGVSFNPNSQKAPNCPTIITESSSTLTGPKVPSGISIGKDWSSFVQQIMKYCGEKGMHTGSDAGTNILEMVNNDTLHYLNKTLKSR